MTTVYVAIGSNKGDSPSLVKSALSEFASLGRFFKASSLHQTAPVDCEGGPFINAVCSFETDLSFSDFVVFLENLERKLGKEVSKLKSEARTIDLDILFYGSQEYCDLGYTIPHPLWQKRLFVLAPLSEITDSIECGGNIFNISDLCKKLS